MLSNTAWYHVVNNFNWSRILSMVWERDQSRPICILRISLTMLLLRPGVEFTQLHEQTPPGIYPFLPGNQEHGDLRSNYRVRRRLVRWRHRFCRVAFLLV